MIPTDPNWAWRELVAVFKEWLLAKLASPVLLHLSLVLLLLFLCASWVRHGFPELESLVQCSLVLLQCFSVLR